MASHIERRKFLATLGGAAATWPLAAHAQEATTPVPAAPFYIPIIVATLPVILSPIVAWAIGRSRISKEGAAIDYLNKRLDILERLNKLQTQLMEGPIKPFLDMEIEHCRAFLRQPPTFIERGAEKEVAAAQSRDHPHPGYPSRRRGLKNAPDDDSVRTDDVGIVIALSTGAARLSFSE